MCGLDFFALVKLKSALFWKYQQRGMSVTSTQLPELAGFCPSPGLPGLLINRMIEI